ncbi:pyridoxamine 5'-phosphate oxidase family protein [Nocardioides sp. W7]|uniref:pyridoxamine 5'-phosphate oxidase family protein n=1 Tax=Nocardioides sp. W7 TaxID=2931390 RepID=UPI001FD304AC|nr:pyridoxamine 5'-phosphate oxidase family protein [Nocardioides sp. W7]
MTNKPGQLRDLSAPECWELLTTAPVGRIIWNTASGPEVVPVNFVADGSTIRIRTAAYSALVQKVDAERVAFEADSIDETDHSGWSVVARGRAEVRYGADDGPTPEPWVGGTRHTIVAVVVDQITGRRLTTGS